METFPYRDLNRIVNRQFSHANRRSSTLPYTGNEEFGLRQVSCDTGHQICLPSFVLAD